MAKTLLPEIMEREKQSYQDKDVKGLTWDDLVLVLESYKNMISLNTTLLDRQQKVIELEEQLLALSMLKKKELDEIKDKLEKYIESYQIKGSERDIVSAQSFSNVQREVGTLSGKITVMYIIVSAIIIPLVGLVVLLLTHMIGK
jgi:hypothetical protein